MTGYESKRAAAHDKLDSMEREALKLALEEYLCREMPAGTVIGDPKFWVPRIATAIKEALAQPEQERNFCPRCGKRTADLTTIHTCTPPQEKNT
jgi:hypothetical protein